MTDDIQIVALEGVRLVQEEYGLTGPFKPCIAHILDGNIGSAGRHEAAFTIAMELRGQGLPEAEVTKVLEKWAAKVEWPQSRIRGAIHSAFKRKPGGAYQYFSPGLEKKPGGRYHDVLASICADVGCPDNCPPYMGERAPGLKKETEKRFEELGWPQHLQRKRQALAARVYQALCKLERQKGLYPGTQLFVTYRMLAEMTGANHTAIGKPLHFLASVGLIDFTPGSGSGPNARDKKSSRVRRRVPIPKPPNGEKGS